MNENVISTLVFIIFISVSCFIMHSCAGKVNQQGQKNGILIKASDEGLINTTHESELIKGGMTNGSGSFSVEPFFFTIEDKDLFDKSKQYMMDQKEVLVTYHCKICSYIDSESSCFADKIEEVK